VLRSTPGDPPSRLAGITRAREGALGAGGHAVSRASVSAVMRASGRRLRDALVVVLIVLAFTPLPRPADANSRSLVLTAQAAGGGPARAVIEDELVIQTPMSAFVVDSMLKEFVQHAKDKLGVTLKTRVLRAGTPVSYETIVNWAGQPEADVFWGGEPALFGDLAAKNLLVRLELPGPLWESVPVSIGSPKPIPLKAPTRFWVGTALEAYGIAYSPRLLNQLGVADLRDWDDLLQPKLKGQIVQCTPTRSSSSHATYQVILQIKGDASGWEWLRRLGGQTGRFVTSSREVPSLVARTELAVGFGVPSYYAFEEKLAGFDIRFVAPQSAFVTPEPIAILAGAKHPKAAQKLIAFLLSERGQQLFMGRGLFPVIPRYKVHGPPGSTAELAVQLNGGVRSFFDPPMWNVYDDVVARTRYQEVNEKFQRDIEAAWDDLKKRY
jgi:iron(III) transport system substrate-binding protein